MPITSTGSYVITDLALLAGEPIIAGTKTPVRAIAEMWRMGVLPEEIPTHLPHLTLAQVFDALRYYADNQSQINRFIEANRVPDELVHPLFQRELVAA
jgi:uncharacterized protein (DUF433 family)